MDWNKLFRYDAVTGNLHWRIPRKGIKPGSAAGTKHTGGYLQFGHMKKKYFVHRVVWDLMNPDDKLKFGEEIDHKDHDKTNNRLSNLRKVSRRDNARNLPKLKTNTSGVTGVVWRKREKTWQAQLRRQDTCIYLGCYTNFFDAVCARKSAEIDYGFHKNHGKDIANEL